MFGSAGQGDYPKEYEALYHSNFGPPLLDPGSGFSAPVQQVSPFNDRAAPELSDYQTYKPPTPDYDETVFNVVPCGDDHGDTLAVLHNAAGNLGISLAFNINELPVFSLWKSTDTMGQGYVTGLEPGTSWAYNRSYQRALNRVPTIGPKEQRRFDINLYFFARQSGGRPSAAKGTDYPEPASNRDARDPHPYSHRPYGL